MTVESRYCRWFVLFSLMLVAGCSATAEVTDRQPTELSADDVQDAAASGVPASELSRAATARASNSPSANADVIAEMRRRAAEANRAEAADPNLRPQD